MLKLKCLYNYSLLLNKFGTIRFINIFIHIMHLLIMHLLKINLQNLFKLDFKEITRYFF